MILVDDSLWTGVSMCAAARAVQGRGAASLLAAVPVAGLRACEVVRDEVAGLAPEVAASLFLPLRRLGAEAVGSGLGLAVARVIVEQHKGQLWYQPGPGQGATFHITLPEAP